MSFIVDSRHFTFSSTKAIVHDEASATYTFAAADLFTTPPSSGVYATVSVESFSAINGFYSITNKNNCVTVDLTPGFYNAVSLAVAVQGLLRPILGSQFSCTYSSVTGKITMSNANNFTVFGPPLTTAWKLLGMVDNTYSGFSFYEFPKLADLMTVSRVILASNIPSKNRDASTGVSDYSMHNLSFHPQSSIVYKKEMANLPFSVKSASTLPTRKRKGGRKKAIKTIHFFLATPN
jgi:hypothetical protein